MPRFEPDRKGWREREDPGSRSSHTQQQSPDRSQAATRIQRVCKRKSYNMAEEPLQMLREYMSQGKIGEVVEDGEDVVFGGNVRIPKKTTTKLRRSKAGARKADGTKEYFTLGSLVFFIKQPPQNFSGYMKQAIGAGYQAVSLLDRNSIRDYLEGKTDTLDAIEEAAPLLPTTEQQVRKRDESDLSGDEQICVEITRGPGSTAPLAVGPRPFWTRSPTLRRLATTDHLPSDSTVPAYPAGQRCGR